MNPYGKKDGDGSDGGGVGVESVVVECDDDVGLGQWEVAQPMRVGQATTR